MCQQSSKILQGYLAELLSVSEKITPEQFVNSDLRVTLQPFNKIQQQQQQRKKRVSKEQRCSLLKKLLLKTNAAKNNESDVNSVSVVQHKTIAEKHRGGLRDLINFTKNFDFGFKIERCKNYDHSPLEKLSNFSRNFFCVDFSEFQSTVLYVIENEVLTDSEEEETLASLAINSDNNECDERFKIEEVIIEPDLKIKKELDFESENGDMYEYSSNFVEVCYDEDDQVAKIKSDSPDSTIENHSIPHNNFVGQNKLLAEIIPIIPHNINSCFSSINNNNNNKFDSIGLANKYKTLCSVLNSPFTDSPPATELLGQFVASFTNQSRKSLSPHSIRCRTRGNPYINPHLQKQFQLRSFKCNTCNRRFKSPGYLNAHIVKLKH